jgi:RHS repeat-associated protein
VRDWLNNSGTNVDHVEYNSFGKRLDTPAIDAAFGWTGRYRDAHTGLQYNNARWYDPAVGRWLSEDPIGFAAQDPNLSRYVANAPTTYVDPTGLDAEHHIVPKALWDKFGFGPEAKKAFGRAVIKVTGDHDYSKHGAKTGYTAHVTKELNDQLCEFMSRHGITDGVLSPELQEQFAKDFVKHIRTTKNPYIRGFNNAVRLGREGIIDWWENRGGKDIPQPRLPNRLTRVKGIAEAVGETGGSVAKKLARKLKGPLPFVLGVPFSIYCFPENVRAKGFGRALADEALDTIPIVEWVKPGTEIVTGKDWVPPPGEKGFFDQPQGEYRPYRPPTDRPDPTPWGWGPKY